MSTHIISPFKEKGHFQAWLKLQDLIEEVGEDQLPCVQAPDLYHPGLDEKHYAMIAKEACKKCPIQMACAAYAVRYEREGIWGGLSATERLKLRKSKDITVPRKPRRP